MFEVTNLNAIARPDRVRGLLTEGWEPFAASGDYLWLRRETPLRKVEEPKDWFVVARNRKGGYWLASTSHHMITETDAHGMANALRLCNPDGNEYQPFRWSDGLKG